MGKQHFFNGANPLIQKTFAFIAGLLVVWLLGACDKPNLSNGNTTNPQETNAIEEIPYKPCPCETPEADVLRGEVYLFKDSIAQQMDYEEINIELLTSGISLGTCVIIFDSKTQTATLTPIKEVQMLANPVTFLICNFPDFAKEWDIPQNGCKVSIDGTLYGDCGGIAYGTHLNYVLKHFKSK
jgi:hypothetical protein